MSSSDNSVSNATYVSQIVPVSDGGTSSGTSSGASINLLPDQTGQSGKVLSTDGTNASWTTPSSGGSPGGSDTNVQYNDGGAFGGDANLTWDKNLLTLTVEDISLQNAFTSAYWGPNMLGVISDSTLFHEDDANQKAIVFGSSDLSGNEAFIPADVSIQSGSNLGNNLSSLSGFFGTGSVHLHTGDIPNDTSGGGFRVGSIRIETGLNSASGVAGAIVINATGISQSAADGHVNVHGDHLTVLNSSGTPIVDVDTLSPKLDLKTNPIVNVQNPTNPQDAATKSYVDNAVVTGPLSSLDGSYSLKNTSDNTKLQKWDLSGETTGKTITFAPVNTSNMTVQFPQVATSGGSAMALLQDITTGFIFSNGITSSIGGANSMMQLANATTANRAQIKLHSYFNGNSVAGVSTLTSRSGTIAVNAAVVAGQDYSKWTAQAAATTPGSAPISGTFAYKANTVNSLTVTSDYHIQLTNLAGTLTDALYLTSEGHLLLGTSTDVTNSRIVLKDGHVVSQQTTAPTTTTNSNAGTGASSSVANATDSAGHVNLTSGTAAWASGEQVKINFNKAYNVAPIVVLTPTTATAAQDAVALQVYVTSTTTDFSVNFGVAQSNSGVVYQWNYHVIETQ